MEREIHYPKLEASMQKLGFTPEEIQTADERLFTLNQEYYADKALWERGRGNFASLDSIMKNHNAELQEFWEDTFGEDTWDDRHEIYAFEE